MKKDLDQKVAHAVGSVLRKRRVSLGLSQEKLSFDADMQRVYVSLIERGINQPSVSMLFRIASALEMKASEIIGEVEAELQKEGENPPTC